MIVRTGPVPVDYGPSRAVRSPGGVLGGSAVVAPSAAALQRQQERAYKARKREIARRLDDVEFIGSPEGQVWLDELNKQRARERRER